MTSKQNDSSLKFIQLIEKDLQNNTIYSHEYNRPVLTGCVGKFPIGKGKSDHIYTWITEDKIFSINCLFKEVPDNLPEGFLHSVDIYDYFFDFLVRSKTSKELEYNIILYIKSWNMNKIIMPDFQSLTQKPTNINKEKTIQATSAVVFNKHIQKIINQYNSFYPSNDFSAANFLKKAFNTQPETKQVTFDEMIRKVYKISNESDGILLRLIEGINRSMKYFVNHEDDINELLTTKVNWKNLIVNTPTIQAKKQEVKNPFTPTPVLFKEFNEKIIKQEKKGFLQRKVKRDKMSEDEKMSVPKKINDLISFYGDINVNIGNTMIEKYMLYQKYTMLAKEVGLVKNK